MNQHYPYLAVEVMPFVYEVKRIRFIKNPNIMVPQDVLAIVSNDIARFGTIKERKENRIINAAIGFLRKAGHSGLVFLSEKEVVSIKEDGKISYLPEPVKNLILTGHLGQLGGQIYEPDTKQLFAKYTLDKDMRVVFFAIFIRNEALESKYPGGLRRFHEKYDTLCFNNEMTFAEMVMGLESDSWHEIIRDLESYDICYPDDFIENEFLRIEVGILMEEKHLREKTGQAKKIEKSCGADWLMGHLIKDDLHVYYNAPVIEENLSSSNI